MRTALIFVLLSIVCALPCFSGRDLARFAMKLRTILALLVLLVLSVPAQADIGIGTASTQQNTGATPYTLSHTCEAGSDRFIVVLVSSTDVTPALTTSVTYAGVSLTEIFDTIPAAELRHISGHYLVAPATGANNIVVTLANAEDQIVVTALCFTGVDQTTPVGTQVTRNDGAGDGANSITLTTASGEVLIDVIFTNETGTASTQGADQTEIADVAGADAGRHSASTQLGSAGGVMSWTLGAAGTESVMGGFPIKPASGGAAPAGFKKRDKLEKIDP